MMTETPSGAAAFTPLDGRGTPCTRRPRGTGTAGRHNVVVACPKVGTDFTPGGAYAAPACQSPVLNLQPGIAVLTAQPDAGLDCLRLSSGGACRHCRAPLRHTVVDLGM